MEAGSRRRISQDAQQVSFVIHATNPWEHFKSDTLLLELFFKDCAGCCVGSGMKKGKGSCPGDRCWLGLATMVAMEG